MEPSRAIKKKRSVRDPPFKLFRAVRFEGRREDLVVDYRRGRESYR